MDSPQIIKSAMTAHESQRQIMDGVIHSAMLTSFQRDGVEGVLKGGYSGKQKEVPVVKAKSSKTHQRLGAVHFQGSRY